MLSSLVLSEDASSCSSPARDGNPADIDIQASSLSLLTNLHAHIDMSYLAGFT